MLTIPLKPELEQRLSERAAASGVSVEAYAQRVLESAITGPSVEEVLEPIRRRFRESGMTDDALADLLEEEKHAMRRERKAS